MTTVTYPDITHKKTVANRFNPNTYRVISENVAEFENLPEWYGNARAEPIYTKPNPNDLPMQIAEPRNNPHAARKVDLVYTNASTFNAPMGHVRTDNVKHEETRWWDWSQPKAEPYGPRAVTQEDWRKTNESSYRNAFHMAGESGPYARKNTRYSANPYREPTVGIVPVTDLKQIPVENESQNLIERVSFEQHYNSRSANNYPLRGRHQGAFVIEDPKRDTHPLDRPVLQSASTKMERTSSMWDLFHPSDNARGKDNTNPYVYRRPLPQIRRTESSDQVWQTAPYANDFQNEPPVNNRSPFYRQINIE